MRRSDAATIAVALTVQGLIADIAYVLLAEAAPRFLLTGMWAEATAYTVLGGGAMVMLATVGRRRIRTLLGNQNDTTEGD